MRTSRQFGILSASVAGALIAALWLWWPDGSAVRVPEAPAAGASSVGSSRVSTGGEAGGTQRRVAGAVEGPAEAVADRAPRWQVVDSVTRSPLPDAELWVVHDAKQVRLQANAAGWIVLDEQRLPPGLGWVRAPRHVALRVSLVAPLVHDRQIALEPARLVRFEVRWADDCADLPLEGLELLVWPERDAMRVAGGGPHRERVVTDAAGRAACWLAPGTHVVAVRRDGALWADEIVESVGDGPVVVPLPCPSRRLVRVVDVRERRVVAGAELAPDDGLAVAGRWYTRADGTAVLPVAAGSDTAWVARAAGFASQRFRLRGGDARAGVQEVSLSPVTEVRGELVGFGDDVEVVAWGSERHVGRPSRWTAKVESGRRFRIGVRPGERFALFARDTAGRWAYTEQPPVDSASDAANPVSLIARSPLSVAGQALIKAADDGHAATWIDVAVFRLIGPSGRRSRIELATAQLPLRTAGSFRATGLPAGELELRVHAAGVRGPVERRSLDQDLSGVVLELGLVISGRVVRRDGVAAAGAVVVARDASGASQGVARADQEGRFAIAGLDVAQHLVVARLGEQTARLPEVSGGTRDLLLRLGVR